MGTSVFIGIKCTNKGSENKAKPKPVVPFTIPERNIMLRMAIQLTVDIYQSN